MIYRFYYLGGCAKISHAKMSNDETLQLYVGKFTRILANTVPLQVNRYKGIKNDN